MKQRLLPNSIIMVLAGLLLTACGGSGTLSGDGEGIGGGDTGGGGDGQTPTIDLQLVRENEDGEEEKASRIDPSRPATVIATLSTSEDTIVNFSASLGQFDPASGSVLARDGEARITLEAGTTAGAGEVTASATIDNNNVTSDPVAFEILAFEEVEEDLQLGICTGGDDDLDCTSSGTTFVGGQLITTLDTVPGEPLDGIAAQGTAEVALVVVDASTTPPTPQPNVDVDITSRCTNLGEASISEAQSGVNGVVRATYQAEGCEETDNITATIPSSGATATGSIFVFPPRVGSIVFDSVVNSDGDPIDTIFIQGSGGESTARVIFRVLDRFGDPKPDVDVTFALTTTIGGLELQNSVRKTDANGEAVAFVNAGSIATTVLVQASIDIDTDNDGVDNQTLGTQSAELSVNTGIADQNSMSISATTLNVEGEDFDGTTTEITVRLSDLFNNPVRDGTTVQFRTEYGSIQPSCNTSGGLCTVTWTSQEPRRPLDPNAELGGSCPKALIHEEEVTISGTDGDTGYLVSSVGRVETPGDAALVEGTDYTVDSDGSGITCEAGSTACTDGADLKISYYRAWLDEDPPAGDTEHTISNPGVATAPFHAVSIPCRSASRAATVEAPAFHGGVGQIYGGRTTILAFSQGEESFTDSNGNGLYDEGEPFVDRTEAFLDVNEDGVFGNAEADPDVDDSRNNEPEHWNCYGPVAPLSPDNPPLDRCFQRGGNEDGLVDFNENGQFDAGNGIYNGTLCPLNEDGVTTPDFCTRELINIHREIVILSAGSFAAIRARDAATGEYISMVDLSPSGPDSSQNELIADRDVETNDGSTITAGSPFQIGFADSEVAPGVGEEANLTTAGAVTVDIADEFNGVLPAETSISVDGGGVCDITTGASATIDSTNGFGPFVHGIGLKPADNPEQAEGNVTIDVSAPSGSLSTGGFRCKVL